MTDIEIKINAGSAGISRPSADTLDQKATYHDLNGRQAVPASGKLLIRTRGDKSEKSIMP